MEHFCPNLFIPGAAKSGTTSLHELLDIHPDICMSSNKEPVYWNSFEFNNFDCKKKEWYSNLFSNKDAAFFGESTTSYLYYNNFITNVKANYKNDPKFIFILRNPIDRCFSHYWWMIGLGLEKSNFKNAIETDINRSFKPYKYYPDYYYHFGLYAKWLTPFFENFDRKNIKIITLDSLKSHRIKTLNECFNFLGVKKLPEVPEIISNKTYKLKYPWVFHFIKKTSLGKYKYTKVAKYIISKQHIETIRDKLRDISFLKNSKTYNYPKINKEERIWLKSLYQKDIALLKEITNLQFEEWTDFNN